jgi:hypothetical protein
LNKHYKSRKRVEKQFKIKELPDAKTVKIEIITGAVMHKCIMYFSDGNRFVLTLHRIGSTMVLSKPRMDLYTQDKLAVLDYLAQIVFENTDFIVVEDKELYKPQLQISKYQVAGFLSQEETIAYSISAELLNQKDNFKNYVIDVKSRKAKDFKFPVTHG